MLELRDVRVAYGGIEVLRGINLEVSTGEAVGLIGANGAGKTSTLRAIFGNGGAQVAGSVRLGEEELIGMAPEEIAARGLALIPEGGQIFTSLTVAENLLLATRPGSPPIEGALEQFPRLRKRADERAERLSGGERQQLAIARALIGVPRLLALDEPSLGLAPKAIEEIYELLESLRTQGVTMLMTEQSAIRTIEFCDRCLVLGSGEVKIQGDREALRGEADLLGAYLGVQPGDGDEKMVRRRG